MQNNYYIDFTSCVEIAHHSICCRCQFPTENSPIGTGTVPTGQERAPETIKHLVICLQCIELQTLDPNKFWNEGWAS